MLDTMKITYFAEQTIALAQQQVEKGGLPFSSVIVNGQGECIAEGVNQVNELNDCTAHAEIQAIRAACEKVGRSSLEGTTLFASGEPCGLCYLAIRLAKISQVVILLDRYEVKQVGFDYLWTYTPQLEKTPSFKVENLPYESKIAPFVKCPKGLGSIGL